MSSTKLFFHTDKPRPHFEGYCAVPENLRLPSNTSKSVTKLWVSVFATEQGAPSDLFGLPGTGEGAGDEIEVEKGDERTNLNPINKKEETNKYIVMVVLSSE